MRSLIWLIFLALAVALAILVAQHDKGWVGTLTTNDFASLTINVLWATVIGAAAIVLFRGRLSSALKAIGIWALVAVALIIGYTYRTDLGTVYGRVMAQLMPGYTFTQNRTVEVARAANGDFAISARVNGARVPMVLDTGASSVVLTQEAAKAAGLPLEILSYDVPIDTANGRTQAASVTLDHIAIGGLVEKSISALVAKPGQLRVSLLGMTFLNRLESWEVRGDTLRLHGYP